MQVSSGGAVAGDSARLLVCDPERAVIVSLLSDGGGCQPSRRLHFLELGERLLQAADLDWAQAFNRPDPPIVDPGHLGEPGQRDSERPCASCVIGNHGPSLARGRSCPAFLYMCGWSPDRGHRLWRAPILNSLSLCLYLPADRP